MPSAKKYHFRLAGCGIRTCGCVTVWHAFYVAPPPAGGGVVPHIAKSRRRRKKNIFRFFAEGDFFVWCISLRKWTFREVVVEKTDFLYNFGHFCQFLVIFTLFGAFSFCTVAAFLAIFPIFFRIC